MHSVLHSFTDDSCVQIFERVKEAMVPGYSRLLINEQVLPPIDAHWEVTGLDLTMMLVANSRERAEDEWHQTCPTSWLAGGENMDYPKGCRKYY